MKLNPISLSARKELLKTFAGFLRLLPIRYKSFVYQGRAFGSPDNLRGMLRRDLEHFIADHLAYFQSFDVVKIYYDRGQPAVSHALYAAFEKMLFKPSMERRDADYHSYRLSQVADYLCAIELAAAKYGNGTADRTSNKFFGTAKLFKNGYLKQARRKLMS